MKLSIITINYNDAEGLRKTIESVINQTCQNFEYIVIDGNSTDGSKDVIQEFSNKITKWISEPDSGIYNAMNKGARMSVGDYMLFLNSGDYLNSYDTIEKVFEHEFSCDIVCGNTIDFNEKHEYLKLPPRNVSLYTFYGGSLPHPSSFISKNVFNIVGGYIEDYKIISDWCFFIDALLVHKCTYSTIPITISKFNCFGISSKEAYTEEKLCFDFLYSRFGRICNDYSAPDNEAIFNVAYWASNCRGMKRYILSFPFKIINRGLKLRNKLHRKMSIIKLK